MSWYSATLQTYYDISDDMRMFSPVYEVWEAEVPLACLYLVLEEASIETYTLSRLVKKGARPGCKYLDTCS